MMTDKQTDNDRNLLIFKKLGVFPIRFMLKVSIKQKDTGLIFTSYLLKNVFEITAEYPRNFYLC